MSLHIYINVNFRQRLRLSYKMQLVVTFKTFVKHMFIYMFYMYFDHAGRPSRPPTPSLAWQTRRSWTCSSIRGLVQYFNSSWIRACNQGRLLRKEITRTIYIYWNCCSLKRQVTLPSLLFGALSCFSYFPRDMTDE